MAQLHPLALIHFNGEGLKACKSLHAQALGTCTSAKRVYEAAAALETMLLCTRDVVACLNLFAWACLGVTVTS